MTKKETLNLIKTLCADNADITAFCDKEIASLSKKRENPEADAIKATLVETLGLAKDPMTIAEIQGAVPELSDLSNQKISAALTALKNAGVVERSEIKRKGYYALVNA